MNEHEYIILKRSLYQLMSQVRDGKRDLMTYFLRNQFPDVTFLIRDDVPGQIDLNIKIEILGLDKAEMNVVMDSIKRYWMELDERVMKCTTMIKQIP